MSEQVENGNHMKARRECLVWLLLATLNLVCMWPKLQLQSTVPPPSATYHCPSGRIVRLSTVIMRANVTGS